MKLADKVVARGAYLAGLAHYYNQSVIQSYPIGYMDLRKTAKRIRMPSRDVKRVLYLGKLLWSKGLRDLIVAFSIVAGKNANTAMKLDIVGEGPDRVEIESVARDLNLSKKTRFHGWIEPDQGLSDFFAKANVLVVPSSTHPEGVPRVIDEALMFGIPVIATDAGGIAQEFQNDEIVLVERSNPKELAQAVERILFDNGFFNYYKRKAHLRARRWSQIRSAGNQHALLLLDREL
jgi:glycosyltransferase involved in cell wall biosynthesis